jgi:hypothetical protein
MFFPDCRWYRQKAGVLAGEAIRESCRPGCGGLRDLTKDAMA